MRVDVPVSVQPLERAAGIRGPDKAIVDNTAPAVGIAGRIQAEMAGGSCPVVDAAVTEVDDEPGGSELRLGEPLAREPGEITGTGR